MLTHVREGRRLDPVNRGRASKAPGSAHREASLQFVPVVTFPEPAPLTQVTGTCSTIKAQLTLADSRLRQDAGRAAGQRQSWDFEVRQVTAIPAGGKRAPRDFSS